MASGRHGPLHEGGRWSDNISGLTCLQSQSWRGDSLTTAGRLTSKSPSTFSWPPSIRVMSAQYRQSRYDFQRSSLIAVLHQKSCFTELLAGESVQYKQKFNVALPLLNYVSINSYLLILPKTEKFIIIEFHIII